MPDGVDPQDYLRANLPRVEELKRRTLFGAPQPPVAPQKPGIRVAFGQNGLTGVEKPEQPTGPSLSVPPSVIPTDYKLPTEMTNPRLGPIRPNMEGMSPVQRTAAMLGVGRERARDYPSSRITSEGEIEPPKRHGGIKDRFKSGLKGLVINMGEYARTHPGAELPELLGAGGAGAAVGGISPITIDRQVANAAVARREDELGRQIQLDTMRQKPLNEAERIRLEQERLRQTDERAERAQSETERFHRETIDERKNRPRTPREPIIKTVTQPDGSTITKKSTDNGETWVTIPDLTSSAKPDLVDARQGEERQRKRDAAVRELGSLVEAEKNAATQKDVAYQEYGNLQAQYKRQTDADARAALKPQLDAAKQRAEEAQKFYASFGGKKTAAQKAIDENAGEPIPQSSAAPSPSTHVLNKQAWLKSHPASDWPKAVAAAKAAGYQIVQ